MFLAGMLSGPAFAPPDPNEERDPPPEATPITFPVYETQESVSWDDVAALPNFQALFSKVLKPDDISDRHSFALNLDIKPEQPLDELWTGPIDLPDPTKQQGSLQDRLNELVQDNDLAFRTLTKTLPPGVKGPRFAWMRKFWTGLEGMSPYWDSSLDQYYDLPVESETVKRPRLDPELERSASPKQDSSTGTSLPPSSPETTDRTPPRHRYKGRRQHTGRDMPDAFRAETVRAFIEAAAFPYRCSVAPPRQMPIVHMDKLRLPVRQTAAVYRIPDDQAKARQGRHEGPLMAVQVRADTDFVDKETGEKMAGKGRLDLLREVGGLLQIAQERRREGEQEVKPGEGKWWTTKPRWGGGEGGESEGAGGNVDMVQMAEEAMDGARAMGFKGRKRKTPIAVWKELKCGSGVWDSRTDYRAVGKRLGSEFDEIYMVSSLNHHISILRLTVHAAYVDSLTKGTYPDPEPTEKNWSRPVLARSRWYDLLNADDRIEAFEGLWNVMAYLNRDTTKDERADA